MPALCRNKWFISLTALTVLAFVGVGGFYHKTLLAWYCVDRLSKASDAERANWVERVAAQDDEAVPFLLAHLDRSADCAGARAGLTAVTGRWPLDDPRRAALAQQLAEAFGRFSLTGQAATVELLADWVPAEPTAPVPPDVMACLLRLLPLASRSPDGGVRGAGLELAAAILRGDNPDEVATGCREWIRRGFQDGAAANRAQAARLAARPEVDLLPQIVPLLDDPDPGVRKAALLAVGPAPDAITTDDLLRSLHDPDEDVRRLCEAALKECRKLSNDDVTLGRLISDSRPGMRLQVLDKLRQARDLEPGVWLRRLSHDPAPAVRAAALRAAADERRTDLSERLQQMAQSDPSPTVRQLAQYYLTRRPAQLRDSQR